MKTVYFLVKNIFNRGGDTRATAIIANRMCKDYEVNIISLFKTSQKTELYLNKDINIISLFEEPFSLRKNYFKVYKKLKTTIENCNIDILIIGAIGFNCIVYPIVKNKKIKLISCEHASYYDGGKVFGMAWFGRKIACKLNDAVIVLTKKDLQDYKENMGRIKNIKQIYNPLDPKLINRKYNSKSKKILTCGRLVHVKGYDYLIDVAEKVFKKHPDWEWHIYGDGPEKNNIERKIKEYGMGNNVKLLGEISDIYEKYSEYSFYVMTSRSESFGMVLVEALKSGIPVVSFDCNNGPREIINKEVNGILIECFDINKMVECISKLIEDENMRKFMASNSQYNLDKFGIEKVYYEWRKLIDEI